MRLSRPALALSVGFVAAWLLYLAAFYRELPPMVASHFDLAGRADGHQSRGFFATFTSGVALIMLGQFALLPRFVRRYPNLWNVPNRERLLAPERRERTFSKLTSYLDWFGAATLAMTCALFLLIVRVNLERGTMGASVAVLLAAYLAFALGWTGALLRDLRRESREPSRGSSPRPEDTPVGGGPRGGA